MTGRLKLALTQVTAGRDLGPNIEKLTRMVRRAAEEGADLVAMPENATLIEPVQSAALRKACAEDDHPALPAFRNAARDFGLWLLIGSLSIRRPDGKIANRSFLISDAGDLIARYDKIHLFDVELASGETYRESDYVAPGEELVLAPTPWGPLGMTVCYDLRFPQVYRALAKAGAVFLSVPSAFTQTTGEAHWHALLRARAIETGSFVIAPAQWGVHAEGRKTFGHSLVVDPWGRVLADGEAGENLVFATLDPQEAETARRRIPSLGHDREFKIRNLTSPTPIAAE